MYKNFLALIITYIFCTAAGFCAQYPSLSPSVLAEELAKGLKVVAITTEAGEEPTCDYVSAPAGCFGNGIANAIKVPGSVMVYSPDGDLIYDSGEYEKSESGMTVKLRGNSSAYLAKKPYKIKLQKKGDLLGRNDKNLRDKNWVLLVDNFFMLHCGFRISRQIGMEWTPESEYVNLIFNGEPRGVYLLAESVERNENCRISVSESGFIAELDPYWWTADGEYINSQRWWPSSNYTLKYPDFQDVDTERHAAIGESLVEMERAISSGNYAEVIDMESFAKFVMIHDIMGNSDSGGVNKFYAKSDMSPSSLIRMPVAWDFDMAENTPWRWSAVHNSFFAELFSTANNQFINTYVKLWNEVGEAVFDDIFRYTTELRSSEWLAYSRSMMADSRIWGVPRDTPSYSSRRMEKWYKQRREWMRGAVSTLYATDIDDISEDRFSNLVEIFGIDGQALYRGEEENATAGLKTGLYIIRRGNNCEKIFLNAD